MAASYDGDGNRVFRISRSKAVTTVLKSDTSDAEKNPEASNSGIADPEAPGSFENDPSGIEDAPSANQTEVRTYYEKIYANPEDSIFWYGFGQGLMNFFGNINSALSVYLSNWFCTAWDYVTGQYDLVLHSEVAKESVTYSEADIEAMKKAGLTEEDILAVTCGAEYTDSAEICTEGTLTSETVVIPENGDNDTETVNVSYELTYYVNNVNTENTQVLMEYGKRDELKSVYTYGLNRISVETIADTYNPAIDEFETD